MPTCITEGCKHKLPNDADIYNATVITAADISPLRDTTAGNRAIELLFPT